MTTSAFSIGDKVRIASDYHDQTLQGRRGTIASLPDEEHPEEYQVMLGKGPLHDRIVWVHADYLKAT
jgi:hypothetical protein